MNVAGRVVTLPREEDVATPANLSQFKCYLMR
jgi:hypothetical protein